jgi:hypothetical protein
MKTREEIIQLIPKNTIGAEIGVFEGAFSEYIIDVVKPKGYYLVDLFTGKADSGDKNGENMRHVNLDHVYTTLLEKYKNIDNVQLYRGKSNDFLNSLPDNYLDFIYIDGDHGYEGCKSDLLLAKNKVKKNGIIAGHDYCERFATVMKAVDEFVAEFNLNVTFTTEDKCGSYLIYNT